MLIPYVNHREKEEQLRIADTVVAAYVALSKEGVQYEQCTA